MLECTNEPLMFSFCKAEKKKILYGVICIRLLISSTCCYFNTCSILRQRVPNVVEIAKVDQTLTEHALL